MDNKICECLKRKVLKAKRKFIYLLDYRIVSEPEEIRYTSTEGNYQAYIEQKLENVKTVLRTQCRIYIYDGEKHQSYWKAATLLQVPGKESCGFNTHGAYAFYCEGLSFYSGNSWRSYLAFLTDLQKHDKYRPERQLLTFEDDRGIVYDWKKEKFVQISANGMKEFFLPPGYKYLDPFGYCTDKKIREMHKKSKSGYEWKKMLLDDYPKNIAFFSESGATVSCEMRLMSHFTIPDQELNPKLRKHAREIAAYVLEMMGDEVKSQKLCPEKLKIKEVILAPGRTLILRYI